MVDATLFQSDPLNYFTMLVDNTILDSFPIFGILGPYAFLLPVIRVPFVSAVAARPEFFAILMVAHIAAFAFFPRLRNIQ